MDFNKPLLIIIVFLFFELRFAQLSTTDDALSCSDNPCPSEVSFCIENQGIFACICHDNHDGTYPNDCQFPSSSNITEGPGLSCSDNLCPPEVSFCIENNQGTFACICHDNHEGTYPDDCQFPPPFNITEEPGLSCSDNPCPSEVSFCIENSQGTLACICHDNDKGTYPDDCPWPNDAPTNLTKVTYFTTKNQGSGEPTESITESTVTKTIKSSIATNININLIDTTQPDRASIKKTTATTISNTRTIKLTDLENKSSSMSTEAGEPTESISESTVTKTKTVIIEKIKSSIMTSINLIDTTQPDKTSIKKTTATTSSNTRTTKLTEAMIKLSPIFTKAGKMEDPSISLTNDIDITTDVESDYQEGQCGCTATQWWWIVLICLLCLILIVLIWILIRSYLKRAPNQHVVFPK